MGRDQAGHRDRQDKIFCEGKSWGVQGTRSINRQSYPVLRTLSGARERYLVFDQGAGPGGGLRVLHVYPKTGGLLAKLRRLKELDGGFPRIVNFEEQRDRVLVLL